MARKPVAINPECNKRLKLLLTSRGMSQIVLAEKLGIKPNYLSNIVCGRRRLTPDMAQQIVDVAFPDVRVEWLLCKSDIQTQTQQEVEARTAWESYLNDDEFIDKVFLCFIESLEDANGCGFGHKGNDPIVGDYVTITDRNGKAIGALPDKSLDGLRTELEHYAEYLISLYIKNDMVALPYRRKEAAGNG